jgi:DNA-binding transcriptional LysR family regulator
MTFSNGNLVAKLEFRHLQMLVALDEHRSVSKVAEHLNVSQPAVSKALTALEAELNVELFKRTIRGMEPTARGTSLISHARDILHEMHKAHDELQHIREGRVAKLSMGVLPAAAALLVPQFIQRIEATSVGASIRVEEGTTSALLPKLRSGELDFIIGNLSHSSAASDLATRALYEDPITSVVRVDHPLLRMPRITWEDVAQYPLLLPPPKTITRAAIDEFFAQNDITLPRRHIDSVSNMTNIGILRVTDAVGVLSNALANRFVDLKLIAKLPFVLPNISLQMGLIWQPSREREDLMRRVCAVFDEIVATQPSLRT